MDRMRGVVMGTRGLGKGLDDPVSRTRLCALPTCARVDSPALPHRPWRRSGARLTPRVSSLSCTSSARAPALAPAQTWLTRGPSAARSHPHYGIGSEETNYGNQVENGHVLQLAAGFPFETTIAITRLILAGVYDRHPGLKILLAHSGGALTQLSSRLASCVQHDPIVSERLQHDPRYCAYGDSLARALPRRLTYITLSRPRTRPREALVRRRRVRPRGARVRRQGRRPQRRVRGQGRPRQDGRARAGRQQGGHLEDDVRVGPLPAASSLRRSSLR